MREETCPVDDTLLVDGVCPKCGVAVSRVRDRRVFRQRVRVVADEDVELAPLSISEMMRDV